MDRKRLLRNLKSAFLAQGVAFLVSAVMSLIVPKMLGVEEYAYWQLFLLYGAYVPLCHMGLNDGVYLVNGGKTFSAMDRPIICGQFVFGLCAEATIASLLFIWAFLCSGNENRLFVFIALAAYIVIFNIGSYWGAICQAANETHLFSKMQTIDKTIFFLLLMLGVLTSIVHYEYYVVSYIVSRTIADLYVVYNCRSFFRIGKLLVRQAFLQGLASIKVGIKLTVSYIAGIFIIGAPRFVADGVWGLEEFGQLSFAISLMNFFIVFVNQVGMVLFPALRQVDSSEFTVYYQRLTEALDIMLPAVYILYYPIILAVQWWLPQYSVGFSWLAMLLPVCIYNSRMEILSSTAMKVLRQEKLLMCINVTSAIVAVVLAVICGLYAENHNALVYSIVLVTVLRSIVSELLVSRSVGLNNIQSVVISAVFAFIYLTVHEVFGSFASLLAIVVGYVLYLVLKRHSLSVYAKTRWTNHDDLSQNKD